MLLHGIVFPATKAFHSVPPALCCFFYISGSQYLIAFHHLSYFKIQFLAALLMARQWCYKVYECRYGFHLFPAVPLSALSRTPERKARESEGTGESCHTHGRISFSALYSHNARTATGGVPQDIASFLAPASDSLHHGLEGC